MKTFHPFVALFVAGALASIASRVMADPAEVPPDAQSSLCTTQALPELPRAALHEGRQDSVKVHALVHDGVVREVELIHGPRIYRSAIQAAMSKYRCRVEAADYWVSQDFIMDARAESK